VVLVDASGSPLASDPPAAQGRLEALSREIAPLRGHRGPVSSAFPIGEDTVSVQPVGSGQRRAFLAVGRPGVLSAADRHLVNAAVLLLTIRLEQPTGDDRALAGLRSAMLRLLLAGDVDLVRQLLAFSRRQTLRPQVLLLRDTLSDLTILLERLLGENVKLQLVHGRDLWPIKFDLNQFEQVVINLAVNGRDAMPAGGTMAIRTRNLTAAESQQYGYKPLPRTDYVLIEVEDTGTGMPPEVQAKIFEPFFSTKEVGKGTGLGLSTVYGIVKQTGAHIFFTSVFGKGTVFRIFVPRHIPAEGEVTAGLVETNAEIADLTGTATILLVEDEEAVRAFAARALQSRGYKVHEAASGIDALEVMKESGGAIDLVVSDVVMPELDGPSMLRELRKTRPDLKIIFISGYAEDAFRKNLPDGEKFSFLPKPFSLKQLAVAVKETLGR